MCWRMSIFTALLATWTPAVTVAFPLTAAFPFTAPWSWRGMRSGYRYHDDRHVVSRLTGAAPTSQNIRWRAVSENGSPLSSPRLLASENDHEYVRDSNGNIDPSSLWLMNMKQLRSLCRELGGKPGNRRKEELIQYIIQLDASQRAGMSKDAGTFSYAPSSSSSSSTMTIPGAPHVDGVVVVAESTDATSASTPMNAQISATRSNAVTATTTIPLSPAALEDLKRHFRSLIEDAGRSPDSYTYDPSPDRGGHIVKEAFPYIKRTTEERAVSYFMTRRQHLRSTKNAVDKMSNPLNAFPGSPGSGKSTFLAHYPCSDEYRAHVEQHSGGNGKQAIVSTLTFNNGMGSNLIPGFPVFGLRILYGAAKGMGVDLKGANEWENFEKAYTQRYGSLTALQAVEVLRYVFGENRRILILVDEISKSTETEGSKVKSTEKALLKQLGIVLNGCGDVDVVVSSLSPKYIRDLLTPSDRKLIYVFPAPLVELGLGQDACIKWANDIVAALEQMGVKVPTPLVALLRNAYLLFSGHPRSLEEMKDAFENHKFDNDVIRQLQRTQKLTDLLETLVPEMTKLDPRFYYSGSMSPSQLERFMFSTPNSFSVGDKKFREFLEKGHVFIQGTNDDGQGDPKFSVAMPVLSMLQWMSSTYVTGAGSVSSKLPRTTAAAQLLSRLIDTDNMAEWWERVVALTVVCRSFERRCLPDVLGVSFSPQSSKLNAHGYGVYNIAPRVISASDGYLRPPLPAVKKGLTETSTNTLDVYTGSQAGFDAHAVIAGKNVYMQMKIQLPKLSNEKGAQIEKTSDEIIARAVPLTLLHHLWRYHPNISEEEAGELDLTDIHFVLYNWGDLGNSTAATMARVTELCGTPGAMVSGELENFKLSLPAGFNELVKRFLNESFENIHVVNQPMLKEWLLPTLVPLPPLLAAIDSSVDAVE